jgi:hypothetical protein
MKNESEILRRIEALPQPRHLFILPPWADPFTLDQLIQCGYLSCDHIQRDDRGVIQLVMRLELTPRGHDFAYPRPSWPNLALKGSLAGAGLTAMSLVILYLG